MSLVDQGFILSVTLVDNGGNVSTLQYALRAVDFATATTDTATIIAALNSVTNSLISDYYIKNKFSEDAFAYPGAGVENEDKASITVLLSGAGNKKANLKIPAPVIGIFTAPAGGGANVVDLSDVALTAYTDMFKAAGQCTLSDGEDMTSTVSGKRISAKSNRG